MIVTEFYKTREDGVRLVRTYSDRGMMIEQVGTGARYAEAIDPENIGREYIETNEMPDAVDIPAETALAILLGEEI